MSRTLEELAADSSAQYEIKLRLGPETYKKFDGCPFPLETNTDDENDPHHVKDHQIFFIQFNIHLEENDQKELLDWFQELTVPAAKDTTQPDSDTKAAKGSRERNALMFPPSLSKQQRALWHKLAQDVNLQSQSEGFGPARALTITAVPEPKPASPRWDARKHGGGPSSRFRGFKEEERLEKKAKRIWTWCQEEGGSYMQYSQGEVKQILDEAVAMPPDLAALCGKRDMAEKLLQAIANKDEKRAIALLEKDRSLAWVKDAQTGYPLHHAAWHGVHAVVALIIEQKTTMKQKDKNRKSALDIARKRNNSNGSHDSIIQLLKAAGAEDEAANNVVDDRGVADAGTNGKTEKVVSSPDTPPPSESTPKKPAEQPLHDAAAKKSTESVDEDKSGPAIPPGKADQIDTTESAGGSHTRGSGPEASVPDKGETKTERTDIQALVKQIEATTIEWTNLNDQTASVLEQLVKHQRLSGRVVRHLAELQQSLSSQSLNAKRP